MNGDQSATASDCSEPATTEALPALGTGHSSAAAVTVTTLLKLN